MDRGYHFRPEDGPSFKMTTRNDDKTDDKLPYTIWDWKAAKLDPEFPFITECALFDLANDPSCKRAAKRTVASIIGMHKVRVDHGVDYLANRVAEKRHKGRKEKECHAPTKKEAVPKSRRDLEPRNLADSFGAPGLKGVQWYLDNGLNPRGLTPKDISDASNVLLDCSIEELRLLSRSARQKLYTAMENSGHEGEHYTEVEVCLQLLEMADDLADPSAPLLESGANLGEPANAHEEAHAEAHAAWKAALKKAGVTDVATKAAAAEVDAGIKRTIAANTGEDPFRPPLTGSVRPLPPLTDMEQIDHKVERLLEGNVSWEAIAATTNRILANRDKPPDELLCYCHVCKFEVLCAPSDLPDDKDGPIKFVPAEVD